MSKSANAGELRTNLYFKRTVRQPSTLHVTDVGFADEGFLYEFEEDLFFKLDGTPLPVKGKWVNVHGAEVFEALTLNLRDPATITVRYSPKLNDVTLIVYRDNDPNPYEVISIDNVESRNTWLEMKVQRKVKAQ